jgi:hypothetical protein
MGARTKSFANRKIKGLLVAPTAAQLRIKCYAAPFAVHGLSTLIRARARIAPTDKAPTARGADYGALGQIDREHAREGRGPFGVTKAQATAKEHDLGLGLALHPLVVPSRVDASVR